MLVNIAAYAGDDQQGDIDVVCQMLDPERVEVAVQGVLGRALGAVVGHGMLASD